MPRPPRIDVGGEVYHVINRANARLPIFHTAEDYRLFEELLVEGKAWFDMRILAYVIMPNHWHLALYPKEDGDLSAFMHWLTTTHAHRLHAIRKTVGGGHIYQGRYKSFLADTDNYLLALVRYIERNPVRANMVPTCESWQWGSAWRRISGTSKQKKLLDSSPTSFPHRYREWINKAENENDLGEIRASVNRGIPYGGERWKDRFLERFKPNEAKKG